MGFKFRKSFKLSSGLKINFSKRGISASIGKKGLSFNVGTHGRFINAGIPNSSLSYRKKLIGRNNKRSRRHSHSYGHNNEVASPIVGGIVLGFIISLIILITTGHFWISMLPVFTMPIICTIALDKQGEEENIIETNKVPEIPEIQEEKITPEQQDIDLNSLYPNKYGLYPHEILALYILPDENNYAKYWQDRYYINNLPELLRSLKDRGFMTIHFPTDEEILNLYSAADLRTILKNHGIKAPRKKLDMIQSVLKKISSKETQELITAKISLFRASYVLTEKGKEAIKDDEYILYTHKYKGDEFNIYSLNKLMKGDTLNYQKYIWQILNEKCSEYFKAKNFSAYRNTKLNMSDFFAIQQDYSLALKFIIEVIYIDISGLSNEYYPSSQKIKIIDEYIPPCDTPCGDTPYNYFLLSPSDIAPGIIGKLYEYQGKLNLNNTQLAVILAEYFQNINLPFQGFTINECVAITLHALEGEDKEIENIYQQVKERLKKQYPEIDFN